MKILVVSDVESPYLWDYYVPGRLKEFDLIISCGDLKASYLSFLVTMANIPVLYVHGNHDAGYDTEPPEGCECIDDRVVNCKGLRIAGLGGCARYNKIKAYQYTEPQMRRRILRLLPKIFWHGGIDILVTHAPPKGVGDDPNSYSHRGFAAFLPLLERTHPRYLLHGHVHKNYIRELIREKRYADTVVINCCDRYVLEIPDSSLSSKKRLFRKGDA